MPARPARICAKHLRTCITHGYMCCDMIVTSNQGPGALFHAMTLLALRSQLIFFQPANLASHRQLSDTVVSISRFRVSLSSCV
jgi:hypothetical protein